MSQSLTALDVGNGTARYRVRSTLYPEMSYIRQAQWGKAMKFGVFIYHGVEPIDLVAFYRWLAAQGRA